MTCTQRRDDVARAIGAAGIPSAPVRTLPEVGSDPHIFERGIIREVDYPPRGMVKTIGTSIKLSAHAEPDLSSPPTLGEHTEEVLRELLHVSSDEIDALRRAGAI